MSKLLGIGHVHLKVSNLKRAEEFYTKLLGFKVNERVNGYIFLTLGEKHHDLALQDIGIDAKKPTEDTIGLYHYAIEAKNIKELAKLYFKLKQEDASVSPIDHGISKSLYFSDPDDNGIEVYVDTRNIRKNWKGLSKIIPEYEFKSLVKK